MICEHINCKQYALRLVGAGIELTKGRRKKFVIVQLTRGDLKGVPGFTGEEQKYDRVQISEADWKAICKAHGDKPAKMTRVSVYLTPELAEVIGRLSEQVERSQSEVIRSILENELLD